MEIIINGHSQKIRDTADLKSILLELINPKYSSLATLKRNMTLFFIILKAFAKEENLKKEIQKLNTEKKRWAMINDRETFVMRYYDFVLSLEGLYIIT